MDNANHDKVFVRTFIAVLGVLFGITFSIMLIAYLLTDSDEDELDPLRVSKIEQRLQPVGTVVTDPAQLVEVKAPAPKADTRTGEQIVQTVCAGCHGAGVLGAPKDGSAADWKPRLAERGLDGLVKSAINGRGAMPPRGGDPSLSDEQITEAVKYMLKHSGL